MPFEKATIHNTTNFAGFLITLAQLIVRDPHLYGASHRIETLARNTGAGTDLVMRVRSSATTGEWTTALNITLVEAPPGDFGQQTFTLTSLQTTSDLHSVVAAVPPEISQPLDRWQASDRAAHMAAVERVIASLETTVEALRLNETVVTTAVPQGD